jgi:hypothetical protein
MAARARPSCDERNRPAVSARQCRSTGAAIDRALDMPAEARIAWGRNMPAIVIQAHYSSVAAMQQAVLNGVWRAAGVRILVIKHGALGDIILGFPGLGRHSRGHHPGAAISLLTTSALRPACWRPRRWFDRVVIDARPKAFWNMPGLCSPCGGKLRGV